MKRGFEPGQRRAWALLLLAGVSACETDGRAAFDFDAIVEPPRECVTVIHDALELGGPLHAFISDRPGASGGWGLVEASDELFVVRVPGSVDEPPTQTVRLHVPIEFVHDVQLRAGVDTGEAWVLVDNGVRTLVRLSPGVGELGRNAALSNFPAHDGQYCESQQTRVLVLIEGHPYILALPACSTDSTLRLHLLALERETLQFGTAWQLTFDPCVTESDPAACALLATYTITSVGRGDASSLPNLARVHVGLSLVRAFDLATNGARFRTDVSMLDMRINNGGPEVRLVTFTGVWSDSLPSNLGRVALSQDPWSTQMYVRNQLAVGDAALLRFDTVADRYTQISGSPELLPLDGRGELFQLDNQGAMLSLEDGVLRGVALRDVDSWPSWTTTTLIERDNPDGFEAAGPGSLLLRFADAPPQLVHVACVD